MSGVLVTVLPALLPALIDGVRGLIARITGGAGAKPQNVNEVIALMQADTARLQALAALDAPGANVSLWVADVRAMQRPLACLAVIVAYVFAVFNSLPQDTIAGLGVYAQMVTFYLFGDRSYSYFKSGK